MTQDAVYKLNKELPKAEQMAALLQQMDSGEGEIDPTLLLDTIEGETDLLECIDLLYQRILDDQIIVEGIKVAQAALAARKSRTEKTIETHRNLILMAMDRVGIKEAIKRPQATFSIREVPEKLEVVEESDVPADYWVPQDPKLDTKALLAALKEKAAEREIAARMLREGETLNADDYAIPGARLTDKGIGLTIRVK